MDRIQFRRSVGPLLLAAAATFILTVAAVRAGAADEKKREPVGYEDTPVLPGQPWRVHDIKRPHPRMVTPGQTVGQPPSDAVVLFNGKDMSQWVQRGRGADRGKMMEAKANVATGYFEMLPGAGDLISKEKFGDAQYHVEWASPAEIKGESQSRGNSGFMMMSRYEIQVLDAWNNLTYADGQAGSIYGQWPPLVNPAR